MPINEKAIHRLNSGELSAVFLSDAFSGQRKELLATLQRKDRLKYNVFTIAHENEGCEVVHAFHGRSIDGSNFCRNHGVSSETFISQYPSKEISNIDAEKKRFSFVQHIIKEEPERASLSQAWTKFEGFVLSWTKSHYGLHYLSNCLGNTGDLSPFLEKIQLGVKSLSNQKGSNEDSIMTAGLLSHLVFGVDHNFGILLEGPTDDDKSRAMLFCKEMLPNDFLPNNLHLVESINWDELNPSG